MNSLLVENAIYFDESFILPKSVCLCVIRYIEDEGMARGREEEQNMMIVHGCAREEREEGATQGEEIVTKEELKLLKTAGVSGLHAPDYPAHTHRSIRPTSTRVSGGAVRAKCDNSRK